MADVHNQQTRSFNMSRIKGKDTKPEMMVRKYLHSQGFRYKLHDRALPGKPDLVFPKRRTVLFIHGCFWHGHENCRYFVPPKTRTAWWLDKIGKNKQRDAEHLLRLQEAGWRVITIFECALKPSVREANLDRLQKQLAEENRSNGNN